VHDLHEVAGRCADVGAARLAVDLGGDGGEHVNDLDVGRSSGSSASTGSSPDRLMSAMRAPHRTTEGY
jgi:hypothetical protein